METTTEEQEGLRIHYWNWLRTAGKEIFQSGLSKKEIQKLFREEFSDLELKMLAWNFSVFLEELEQAEREENNLIN